MNATTFSLAQAAPDLREMAVEAAGQGRAVLSSESMVRSPLPKGSPGDVVTAVDRDVEESIRNFLLSVRPEDRIVGEELPEAGDGTSGIDWYVDPIDGTSNFVSGMGPYCTSVGAYDAKRNRWIAGAVMLHDGVCYSAASGQGALKTEGRRSFPLVARVTDGAPRLLGTGFSYDTGVRAEQLQDVKALMEGYDDMRCFGTAAYALCLVAEGALAAFVESDLYVYDWSAGALIAEEAGAIVLRPGLTRGGVEAVGLGPVQNDSGA